MRYSRAGMLGGLSLAVSAALVGIGGGGASASLRATTPSNVSTSSFTNSFTFMKEFKALAKAGHGKVAAILPDTVSSTRYVEFDGRTSPRPSRPPASAPRSTWCRTPSAVTPRS